MRRAALHSVALTPPTPSATPSSLSHPPSDGEFEAEPHIDSVANALFLSMPKVLNLSSLPNGGVTDAVPHRSRTDSATATRTTDPQLWEAVDSAESALSVILSVCSPSFDAFLAWGPEQKSLFKFKSPPPPAYLVLSCSAEHQTYPAIIYSKQWQEAVSILFPTRVLFASVTGMNVSYTEFAPVSFPTLY